ncbi:glycoside hydrolase family 2 protein [Leifsonia sp. ZF2019]|uniref:glycoside hydrolase family 2 protein n=1 Tax=Leifsonia sp. ZF2019 TaxID=2781978 RepID=UPI001CBD0C00|nr:glycoside hydrolase family 2 protein [Leifsonia sp. ZF2019]UAJ79513.1 glycoside hydrolase family 2 protein [Leifsonia sp. ZF2019]
MISHSLDNGWVVRAVGPVPPQAPSGAVAAPVPGSVHAALRAAGVIPDPLVGRNEREVRWVGETDWEYTLDFEAPAGLAERTDLVFDGLDTIATVELNGAVLGAVMNQHRSYRFDVTGHLRADSNALTVRFASPLRHIREEVARLGARPHLFDDPFNMIRKSAANFGWDWGPSLPTAGIWRSVRLETWSGARLGGVTTQTRWSRGDGFLRLRAEIEWSGGSPAPGRRLEVRVGDTIHTVAVETGQTLVTTAIDVPDIEPWWPRSHGSPVLHPLEVRLMSDGGAPPQSRASRIGFRSIDIVSSTDVDGRGFGIAVNGEIVAIRGANWIPLDILQPSRPATEYRRLLEDAADAHMNLIRVWGGGTYEADAFYEICDELGLLVWQDFLFACAAYPEEEPLASEVEAEAREAVSRLAGHACIALWCGNNENLWGNTDWNWQAELDGRTWGERYYFDVLPAIVQELAPDAVYIPGSPFSWQDPDPNAQGDGIMHAWDVWNQLDYEHYADIRPRFVSEFGFQGPPSWAAVAAALDEGDVDLEGEAWLGHQKAEDGAEKLRRTTTAHFGDLAGDDVLHWAQQLNQAHALQFGIDHFRSLGARNHGMIVWQLNDCWPGMSWSLVDSTGRRKPAWAAVRRAYQDTSVAIALRDGKYWAIVVNEKDHELRGRLDLERRDLESGEAVGHFRAELTIAPRGSAEVRMPAFLTATDDGAAEALLARLTESGRTVATRWHYFAPVRELRLPSPRYDLELERSAGGYVIRITARVHLRDLWLQFDRVDADGSVEQELATLAPGESAEIRVRTELELAAADLARFPVVCTANDVAERASRASTTAASIPGNRR